MEKEFVPYELAVKLKELEFDVPCLASYVQYFERDFDCERSGKTYITDIGSPIKIYIGRYTNDFGRPEIKVCSAPLWQQAFDWCLNLTDKKYYLKIIQDSDTFGLEKIECGKTYYLVHNKDRRSVLEKLITLI